MAARSTKALIGVVAAAAVVVAGVYGVRALWNTAKSHLAGDTCSIGDYDLDTDQAAVAAAMVGAVTKYRIDLPERATVLTLAAGLQESKLRNLAAGDGDRDSVGVLQQRPSQGWGGGDPNKLTDVGEATKEFLDALVKVPHWQKLPLAEAVQDVQISADGTAYAKHEDEAQTLADALQGIKPAAISCDFDKPTKVATGANVAQQAREQLGVDTPIVQGNTVRVPGARWQTAAWFVANADRLGIDRVAYDHKQWTRSDGWKDSTASAAEVSATLARLD